MDDTKAFSYFRMSKRYVPFFYNVKICKDLCLAVCDQFVPNLLQDALYFDCANII